MRKVHCIIFLLMLNVFLLKFGQADVIDIAKFTSAYNLGSASLGVRLIQADTGKVIYQYNDKKNFLPASNVKLLTAAASLLLLGSDYRFKTTIYTDRYLHKDTIHNLYIDFSGDPSLSTANIKQLLSKISEHGIRQIKGNIYLVNRVFQGRDYPINISQSDMSFYYATPTVAFTVNENSIPLRLQADKNDHAFCIKQPAAQKIKIINQLQVANKQQLMTCQFDSHMNTQNVLMLSGCLGAGDYQIKFALKNPFDRVKQIIQEQLMKLSLINNHTAIQKLHQIDFSSLKTLSTHCSAPLYRLVWHMLQNSDNLYAQAMTRTLGKQVFNVGSFIAGKNAILAVLKDKLGVDVKTVQLEDGAGMSQNDLLNAYFISSLLFAMQKEKVFNFFFNALPIAGVSGTLSERMKQPPLKGVVHAKTGTGTFASALSGYMVAANGQKRIFSILVNGLMQDQKASVLLFEQQLLQAFFYLK
ncbi:D-alanyl-D-alanine carboxypeptidase/D-alanyl-D-alanine endopeptidase [Facilibium subflavum]|uniref:D-alanyl-D-alanine carboxypeptidase/D-alanyl-D-alanine endopeptidase n=1 Tax=Facilibium subflavum TaxID=2219058 RepID=UPI0013C2BBF7|nr:D-alanyl-D-alanine carboxypeptidase/D-alanyl-D-alanine-endopeptidase [Facilibium subflavum]